VKPQTLKEALSDWSDLDHVRMTIAIGFGLMTEETNYQTDAKHVFWSNHPIGNLLYDLVHRLVVGVLEHRNSDDDLEYRWNSGYKGSWEIALENRLKRESDA